MRSIAFIMFTILGSAASTAVANVVDFSDKPLSPNSYYNGGPTTNDSGFTSGGAFFNNSFTDAGSFTYYNGFAYSDVVDTTTPGIGNQYASYAGGGASGAGDVYGVAFDGPAYINLPAGQRASSVELTNTTYAALIIKDGDPNNFARAFHTGDSFTVTLTGYAGGDETGGATGGVTFYLADYRSANAADHYVVNTWDPVDLAPLGNAASIGFTFASTDTGAFGINTPTYVAVDDLTTVPEPAMLGAAVPVAVGLLARRRRTA